MLMLVNNGKGGYTGCVRVCQCLAYAEVLIELEKSRTPPPLFKLRQSTKLIRSLHLL